MTILILLSLLAFAVVAAAVIHGARHDDPRDW